MRVLGIDPGTGICGFGVVDIRGQDRRLVDAGVVRTPPHQQASLRLVTIYDELKQIIKQNNPEIMVIEKLFFNQNVTTAMSVSEARGVMILLAQQSGLTIQELTPLQIKQSTTGDGRASKQQVQDMVKRILGLSEAPKPDDCADALAAALAVVAR